MDWGIFVFDIVADAMFSMLYANVTIGIGNKLSSKLVGKLAQVVQRSVTAGVAGLIDTIIDIFQTILYNDRKTKNISFSTGAIRTIM